MNKNTLLLEIGIEDIPSIYLLKISKIIKKNFENELKKNNFKYKILKCFATSRRIAIQIFHLNVIQENFIKIIKGPYISNEKNIFLIDKVQFWIKKQKIHDIKNIFYKKNYVFYKKIIKGLHIKNLLTKMVINSLKKISSIPNFMYWDKDIFKFIRPIRNLVFVLDKKNIRKNILNIKSNNIILGHRFMCKKKIILKNALDYEKLLFEQGKVVVDFIKRKNIIINKIKKITNNLNSYTKITNIFLEELTSMVEWPILLLGKFNKKFLFLPSEILVYVMEKCQKYIPLYDKNNHLLSNFIVLINIETNNYKMIINSHEQILKSKFKDVKFFFENDLKIKLEVYLNKLKNIIFQKSLGNLFEKTLRIEQISKYLAKIFNVNIKYCVRASKLFKCDLATQMVYEFPELQGIIGMYYAKYNQENKNVIKAIKELYKYQKNYLITKNIISCILFISDKIDTLVGIASISLLPTGNKDPFALKIITLNVIRIIIENKLQINLNKLIYLSLFLYKKNFNNKKQVLEKIINFIKNRCKSWYLSLGYNKKIIYSVLNYKINELIILDYKIKALDKFFKVEKKQSILLIFINKRINKILLKNKKYVNYNYQINYSLLKIKEEIILVNYIKKLSKILKFQIKNYQYYNILLILSELYYPIDTFFKKVIINHKNKIIKSNRITILYNIKKYLLIITNLENLY
ncbi:glycine--tRNA ligase subunit beta [Enterobacteriaceae endosymbiont of Donacia versicolorea]|uniref:glycine--tRNA ligase subunit beta n=1 Tax=Enterobacteriaceae endosymbiont of Donacia versicolorea TaxID=2675788 RepID=UPI001448FD08|nr:glycine--tRNA ligase subunit beta [Enterobacteriaceae endosymbiont of Donacia versicolorea]QJC31934.1 glycine--tRNA ligase subunit beta [Enterobacteriaceae endosymbiont of Donacia versicolorea]